MFTLTRISPDEASESVLRDHYRLVIDANACDRPDRPVASFDAVLTALILDNSGQQIVEHWHAREGDQLVGVLRIEYPLIDELRRLAYVEARIHPRHRRRGVASALLRAAIPDLRRRSRDTVVIRNVADATPAAFASATLGFEVGYASISQLLTVDTADRQWWETKPPAGYCIDTWAGAAPNYRLASYAMARNAIHDAPSRGSSSADLHWTADRVREHEAALAHDSVEERVAVVTQNATDRIVGFTTLQTRTRRPDYAGHRDTAVVSAHRGGGLALAVKAAMLREVVAELPQVREIATSVARENAPMLAVNHRLGFEGRRLTTNVTQPLDRLSDRLGPDRAPPPS